MSSLSPALPLSASERTVLVLRNSVALRASEHSSNKIHFCLVYKHSQANTINAKKSNNGISFTIDYIMNLSLPVSVPETPEDLPKALVQNSHYNELIPIHVNLYSAFNVFNMLTYTYITNTVTIPVFIYFCLPIMSFSIWLITSLRMLRVTPKIHKYEHTKKKTEHSFVTWEVPENWFPSESCWLLSLY